MNVPHKSAFQLTKEEKHRIRKEKKEMKKQQMVALVRKDIMKELTLENRRLLTQETTMSDADLRTTTPHKSSCASADPTLPGYDAAISDLYCMTCKLRCDLRMCNRALICARAQITPPPSGKGASCYTLCHWNGVT